MDIDLYTVGMEDSCANMRPMLANPEYMRGYNDARVDAGRPKLQPPSDNGSGKKLNPDLLKGAFAGRNWKNR